MVRDDLERLKAGREIEGYISAVKVADDELAAFDERQPTGG